MIIVGIIILVGIVFGLFGWAMYRQGFKDGYENGAAFGYLQRNKKMNEL